jgi:hypothetical protein
MNTNKVVYWIALAAIAGGLGSEYQHGGFASLHAVEERTGARLCRATIQVQHVLMAAGLLTNHSQFTPSEEFVTQQAEQLERASALGQVALDRAMAQRDAQIARAQAQLAQVQAALERAQLRRVQVLETSRVKMFNGASHRVMTICPSRGRHFRIEAGPETAMIEADHPSVEVGNEF